MIYITRKVHFNAAHRIYNPAWSDEKNEAVFGLCSGKNGHGHNYELEVTVCGEIDPETGYVMDLGKLNEIIYENIVKKVDHKHLNLDVEFMRGVIPSSENFAVAIWEQLVSHIKPAKLHSIRLYETPRNFVEFKG